jgi:hypothetical protein
MFDYHIFHRLLATRLLVSTSSSLRELGVKQLDEIVDQDVLLEFDVISNRPMTKSQRNLLDVTHSFLAAAKQSASWLNADHERAATNIKHILNDCLRLLDTDQLNCAAHIELACCTINILDEFFNRVSTEYSRQDYFTFLRARILKSITSSADFIKIDGLKSLSRILQLNVDRHELAKWISRHDVIGIIRQDGTTDAEMCLTHLINFLSDMRDGESVDGDSFISNMIMEAQKSRSDDDSSTLLSCMTAEVDGQIDLESCENDARNSDDDSSQMEDYFFLNGEIALKDQDDISVLEVDDGTSPQEDVSSTSKSSHKRRSNML